MFALPFRGDQGLNFVGFLRCSSGFTVGGFDVRWLFGNLRGALVCCFVGLVYYGNSAYLVVVKLC